MSNWSHILREEHKLREFVNRMLRRIFGPKRGGWIKLYNVELHDVCFDLNIRGSTSWRM